MSPDLPALRSLLDRLRAATAGDLALDAEVHRILVAPIAADILAGAHTTSLDGAVALAKACGYGWRIDEDEGCTLSDADDGYDARAATPPLSVCAAVIVAEIAKAEWEARNAGD